MSDFPLDELENLIPTLVEETRRLKEQNLRLGEECDRLSARLEEQGEVSTQLEDGRTQLSLSHLACGIHYYQFLSGTELLATGKLVKVGF